MNENTSFGGDEKKYFYTDGQRQFGPFTLDELRAQSISRETRVWFQGLENWTVAVQVPELASLFAAPQQPPQYQTPQYQQPPQQTPNYNAPPQSPGYGGGNIGNYNTLDGGVNAPPQNPYQQTPGYGERPPKNWLIESILATLFCCWPFAIAGIVNAAKVDSRFYAGDYDGAERAAAEAKKWTMIAFWLGISIFVLYFLFIIIAAGAGSL
jgi:hypothetical protein